MTDATKNSKARLLIPFFTAGYPHLNSTTQLLHTLDSTGATHIEIGLPHSDALADGPTIQVSSEQALHNGMHLEVLAEQVAEMTPQLSSKLILFSYYNPLYTYGLERAAALWKRAGGWGMLVPDLPLEETRALQAACQKQQLEQIFLLAPTSTPERMRSIVQASRSFLYLVARAGITGTGELATEELKRLIGQIKEQKPELPVVIGFGISSAEKAQQALDLGADGVVIGSRIVQLAAAEDHAGIQDLLAQISGETPLNNA